MRKANSKKWNLADLQLQITLIQASNLNNPIS